MVGITVVASFIVSLFFSLVIFTLWLRIALRYLHVSTVNPVSQLIHTVTDPVVNPIQRLLKQKNQPRKKYDIAAFITLLIVEVLKIITISLLVLHTIIPLAFLLTYIVADLIIQPCDILFLAILIRVVMNFLNPDWSG